MTIKLHQLLAFSKEAKAAGQRRATAVYQLLQKPALYGGFTKSYEPIDETGVVYPGEKVLLQRTVATDLVNLSDALVPVYDLQAQLDATNMTARADIVVAGEVLAENVPVTTLLWLEKQLVDLRTIISALPLVSPDKTWTYDDDNGRYAAEIVKTLRTRKAEWTEVVVPATDKHPAQTRDRVKDMPEGWWTLREFSGATTSAAKVAMLSRVDKLTAAVKTAREQANSAAVVELPIGDALVGYVLFSD